MAFRDGRAIGYNTDILGFAASLSRDGVKLRGKKVLLRNLEYAANPAAASAENRNDGKDDV